MDAFRGSLRRLVLALALLATAASHAFADQRRTTNSTDPRLARVEQWLKAVMHHLDPDPVPAQPRRSPSLARAGRVDAWLTGAGLRDRPRFAEASSTAHPALKSSRACSACAIASARNVNRRQA